MGETIELSNFSVKDSEDQEIFRVNIEVIATIVHGETVPSLLASEQVKRKL
jgi:hypothetical protein